MKTEINQMTVEELFEGLKSDPDQPFSDAVLMEIAENVHCCHTVKGSFQTMTVEEFLIMLEAL